MDSRYEPVRSSGVFGIVLLKDKRPDLPENLVKPAKPATAGAEEEEGDEPAPPEPFEFDPAKEK